MAVSHRISLAELRFRKMSNADYVLQVAKILKQSKAAIHSFMIRLLVSPIIDYTITGKRITAQSPVQLMIFHINMLLNERERQKLGIPERVVSIKHVELGKVDVKYKSKVMIKYLNRTIDYLNKADHCELKKVEKVNWQNIHFLQATLKRILAIEKLYRAEFHMRFNI